MNKIFQLVFSFCFFFLSSISAFAVDRWPGRGYEWDHGPGMMNWGYGMGWIGPIAMVLFWVAVIVGIIFLIRWLVLSSRSTTHKAEDSAMDILKKRYARGEINKKEFEEKKKDLI
jgi:putative membrane protein